MWHEPPRSRHQIANELKSKGTVYFVERSKTGLPNVTIRQVEKHIYVISPTFPVDYRIRYRTPILNEIYHEWLLKNIKRKNIIFEVVLTFDHTSYRITKHFKNVIYYCGDDFIGNAKIKLAVVNKYHSAIEKRLAASVKLCIVTSEFLLSKFIDINSNTYIVPLGAPTVTSNYLNFKRNKKELPVLGLVAFINRRLPIVLMDELLKRFKILLIGPADEVIIQRYIHNKNAEFVGEKIDGELYHALDRVDVCIAPYDEEVVNKGLTPNKLWLYAALGKPCVVTDVPNIKNWHFEEGVIYKTKNQDFLETCSRAYNEDNILLFDKRVKVAKANSWSKKVDEIINIYYISLETHHLFPGN
jgi:hypothetical protein